MMKSLNKFSTTCIAAMVALAPVSALADEVTLKSNGQQQFEVTGEFISFEDGIYVIQSNDLGKINVRGSNVICIGAACPQDATVAEVAEPTGPITWDVSLWGSRRAFTEHVEKLAELVNEKTNGDFTLNISYGGLAPSRENLDGIAAGDFEMAQFCAGYHPEKNPSITVLELPFLGVSSMDDERAISQAIYEHPAVVADLGRWNATILMPTPQPQYNIAGVGSPPTQLSDFSRYTVRATGGSGRAIEALGSSVISIPAPEVKDALARGEVNAVAFAPHAHIAFETVNNAVWWTTNLNPGTANCPVVANSEALEALPAASRDALLSSIDEALDHFVANYQGQTLVAWDNLLVDRGIFEITLSEDIIASIRTQVALPTAENWVNNATSIGLPGQELLDTVVTTLAAR